MRKPNLLFITYLDQIHTFSKKNTVNFLFNNSYNRRLMPQTVAETKKTLFNLLVECV